MSSVQVHDLWQTLIFLQMHRSFHQCLACLQMLPKQRIFPSQAIHLLSYITHKGMDMTS